MRSGCFFHFIQRKNLLRKGNSHVTSITCQSIDSEQKTTFIWNCDFFKYFFRKKLSWKIVLYTRLFLSFTIDVIYIKIQFLEGKKITELITGCWTFKKFIRRNKKYIFLEPFHQPFTTTNYIFQKVNIEEWKKDPAIRISNMLKNSDKVIQLLVSTIVCLKCRVKIAVFNKMNKQIRKTV